MTYLVTGGAGFIGSNYVKHLLEKGEKVIVLDAFTYAGNPDNLREYINESNILMPSKFASLEIEKIDTNNWNIENTSSQAERIKKRWQYKFDGYKLNPFNVDTLEKSLSENKLTVVAGNIVDKELVEILFNYSDYIVHFAAETHVDRSIMNPDEFIKTDVYGTFVLLEAAKKSEKLKKFVHISTDEVYGAAKEGQSFKETDPLNPRNPYSASKAAADRLVYSYNQTYNVPAIILRPSNNFGPYQYPEKLIPVVITKALNNEHIPVYGDGKQIRDWLYVKDTAKAIELVIEKGKIGEVYNIAGRNERENIYVVKKILEYLGKSESLVKHVKDRPGHDVRYSLDDTKIRNLGFENSRDFESLLEETVEWYVNNKEWREKIIERDKEYREFMKKWYSER